jgi:hypothetical protein
MVANMKYLVLIGIVLIAGLLSTLAVELGIGYPAPFVIFILVWVSFWWLRRANQRTEKTEKPFIRYIRLSLATFGAVFSAALVLAILLLPAVGFVGFELLLNPIAPIVLLALSALAFPWVQKNLR